jgi:DNA-binding NarL/FixJ family response regulator
METVSILIADDHEVIHSGIKDILRSQRRYHVIANAFNGLETIEKAMLLKPDIIFMDISMPDINGIEATREIRKYSLSAKVIALTQHDEKEYIIQFIRAGGDGYLLKNSKKEEFFNAIETVLQGRRYLSDDISERLINSSIGERDNDHDPEKPHLTRREIEIIRKIAEDKSNQEIADGLNISLRTVETHRRNLMQKLKVNSVVALIRYAAVHKLIDLTS